MQANVFYIIRRSYATGEKHTKSIIVDQTCVQLTRQRRKTRFCFKDGVPVPVLGSRQGGDVKGGRDCHEFAEGGERFAVLIK